MKRWTSMSTAEQTELVAKRLLGCYQKDGQWYYRDHNHTEHGPLHLETFVWNDHRALDFLITNASYQLTKMFPPMFRTVILRSEYVATEESMALSIYLAGLKSIGELNT